MKKTFKALLALMASTMAMTSCQDNDEQLDVVEENQPTFITLTAYQEGADTRAAIGSRDEDNKKTSINWSEGDKLNYFGAGTTSDCLTLTSGEGTTTGTFSGEVTKSANAYVMYPYQEKASFNSSTQRITAEVPMTQIATLGTFDPRAALMIGQVNENGSVQFYNAMSYIMVTVPEGCYQVTVKAINRWYTLAGKAEFYFSGGQLTWSETATEEGQAFVRLISGTEDPIVAGTYYIAVLPTSFQEGFEVIYNVNNDIYCKQAANQSSNAHTNFYRNKIKNIGTLSTEAGFYTYKVGKLSIDGTNSVKVTMADHNIGASVPCTATTGSNLNENTFGDYFQWGALRPCYSVKPNSWYYDLNGVKGYVQQYAPYYGSANKYAEGDNLDPSDDIAAMLWGGKWRMPKKEELEACNGAFCGIRIPKAGRYNGTNREDIDPAIGSWWSSTAGAIANYDPSENAYYLNSNGYSGSMYRYFGACVRPVLGN